MLSSRILKNAFRRACCYVLSVGFVSSLGVLHVSAQTFQAPAVIRAELQAVLTSPIEDVIVTFPIQIGQRVFEGDIITAFECRQEKARLHTLEAELASSEHEVQLQQALRQRGATGQAAVIRAELDKNLQAAKVSEHEAILESCIVRAPFSGVVSDIAAGQWQTVTAGAALLELTDPDEIFVEVVVPASVMPTLNSGDELSLILEGQSESHSVTITRMGVTADLLSQTAKVHARFVSPPQGILVGASGIVTRINEGF